MGRGFAKRKNALKKQYLSQAVKYIEQLEKENQALKNDPNSVIGQFIGQFQELYGQNSRLSVLAAALIKKLGDSVELTKEEMEAFQNNRINIKWELPEGVEKHEDAKSYIFTYELAPAPAAPNSEVLPTEEPGKLPADVETMAIQDVADEEAADAEMVAAGRPDVVTLEDEIIEVAKTLESE